MTTLKIYFRLAKEFDLQEDGSSDWTYIIRDPLSNRVKIGTSRHPTRRLRALQAYSPNDLEVLLLVDPCFFHGSDERELHQRFAKDRLHGEWFTYSPAIQAFVQQMIAEGA